MHLKEQVAIVRWWARCTDVDVSSVAGNVELFAVERGNVGEEELDVGLPQHPIVQRGALERGHVAIAGGTATQEGESGGPRERHGGV